MTSEKKGIPSLNTLLVKAGTSQRDHERQHTPQPCGGLCAKQFQVPSTYGTASIHVLLMQWFGPYQG